MISEEDFEITAGITGPTFQFRDGHQPIGRLQRADTIFDNTVLGFAFPQHPGELILDKIRFSAQTVQPRQDFTDISTPLAEYQVGGQKTVSQFNHRHAEKRIGPVWVKLDPDETSLSGACLKQYGLVPRPDKIHPMFTAFLYPSVHNGSD